ncbi:MAG: phosphate ABC transporter permease subunit PstC [Candidatus Omnitrophica bacterium]|nr:phosphate ABC transporter permease subunit PstC [Candidatus Omnitrophota bacterium]MCM8829815.1 phosphate ABC transporter permease subunit PstC [Candidatus Omnitrophota bacterium]
MHRVRENIYKWVFAIMAFASIIFLVGITITLITQSFPLFREIPVKSFLLGKAWYPTYDPPEFGTFPLVAASVFVTFGALLVCVPLGIGSALYMNEIAGYRQKSLLKPLIEILASIPSVVYGFFGMVIVAPFIQKVFNLPTGLTAFTGSIVLGIMATPTVASIAEDALSFVPKSFREASLAVGANRWQTLIKVVIPSAGSGISTAVILGISRAIGETMTVLMVTGGAAIIPKSFFQPVRPMTSTIAAEMGEAVFGGLHYNALFAIGLVLFIITLFFNILAEFISNRYRLKLGAGR